MIQLTYHETNLLGSGCWERTDGGLSNFGVDAVREMNRLGIVIDLSHVRPENDDGCPLRCPSSRSQLPMPMRAVFCGHPRNKEEDALKLLAEKGGRCGCYVLCEFSSQGIRFDCRGFCRCY